MIDSYSFGRMVVDGKEYSKDLIILPDKVLSGWWRQEGHFLSVNDLKEFFDVSPDVLVIGTGASGRMEVPDETLQFIEEQGIIPIVEKTGDAWKIFNEESQKEKVVGAFHLTC